MALIRSWVLLRSLVLLGSPRVLLGLHSALGPPRVLNPTFRYALFVMIMQLFVSNMWLFKQKTFFSIWVFFHEHSQITGLQGKGEGISLTPHYHFHPLRGRLGIGRAIAAGSEPLRIASSRASTGNLWFSSSSR